MVLCLLCSAGPVDAYWRLTVKYESYQIRASMENAVYNRFRALLPLLLFGKGADHSDDRQLVIESEGLG